MREGRSISGSVPGDHWAMDTGEVSRRGAAGKSLYLTCWASSCGLPQPGSADQGLIPGLFLCVKLMAEPPL